MGRGAARGEPARSGRRHHLGRCEPRLRRLVERAQGATILWVILSQKPQFLGVELEESRKLALEVLRQYKRPEFQARFSWRPGSVAFWDNRAAVHYAVRNYGDFPRLLERILISDERLYADL